MYIYMCVCGALSVLFAINIFTLNPFYRMSISIPVQAVGKPMVSEGINH